MPTVTPRRCCPRCQTVTIYSHCPECRKRGMLIAALTLVQLRKRAEMYEAGSAGIQAAINALTREAQHV